MKNKGFTLVEMLVTILLVSIGLVGVLAFFNTSLNSQFDSKNELIAAGLAQEGTELVRNLIDYKVLNGADWTTISGISCNRIDYRSLSGTHQCNNGVGNYICFIGGHYQQCDDSSHGIEMTRALSVAHTGSSPEDRLEITATVSWNQGSRTTVTKDIIYANNY